MCARVKDPGEEASATSCKTWIAAFRSGMVLDTSKRRTKARPRRSWQEYQFREPGRDVAEAHLEAVSAALRSWSSRKTSKRLKRTSPKWTWRLSQRGSVGRIWESAV